MTEQELDQMVAQSENTQRIVTNLTRTIKEASYPGAVAYQIAEGVAFLEDISRQIKNGLEKLKADRKAAKKAGPQAVPDLAAAPVEEPAKSQDEALNNVG